MTLDSVVERLNTWGGHFVHFVWLMLWQSSVLIVVMFLLDLVARRRLRPSVRCALWLVVLIKLLLPPSLAFPTGVGWWLRRAELKPVKPPAAAYVVTYGASRATVPLPNADPQIPERPRAKLSAAAWALTGTSVTALGLLGLLFLRWCGLRRELRPSRPTPTWLTETLGSAQNQIGYHRRVRIVLTDASISPALWGLVRPVIILPAALVERLMPEQLRAVLLHELFHLRNGDVWFNCFQSLLQIVYWWHPLLWLANSRIRSIREEAVDDAVRLALGEEAESYPPTLLEVARLALARPVATLGLVGILESRHALRRRVERLTSLPAPRKGGLTMVSVFAVFAFAGVALPMGQAPAKRNLALSALSSEGHNEVRKTTNPKDAAWEIAPLTERGSVEYDLRTGIASATNGVVLTHGDTTLSSDNITVNRETGEITAEGSAKLQKGNETFTANKVVVIATNLQLAQIQIPSTYPTASGQRAVNGRARILNKLDAIRLDNVVFDNLPLSEVVNYLSNEAKKRDPEGKGINFIFMPYIGNSVPGTIDPATRLPIAPADVDDLNSVIIKLPLPLNDVRMLDVLDAITKVADKRIRYSIEDYGVSFRLAGNEPSPSPLFARTIKVDPGVFAQGLESVVGFSVGNFQTGGQGGGGQQGSGITVPRAQVAPNGVGGGQGGGIQGGGGGISGVTRPTAMISPQAVRQFFANAGVGLTPPKSIFYNDRTGSLMVHATLEDIETIEKAVGSLSAGSRPAGNVSFNPPAPVSLPPGLDYYLGNTLMNKGSIGLPSGTNSAKLPIRGGLPVLGRASTRTVEVVKAASPGELNQNANARLLARIIKLDPNNFFAGVQRQAGLPAGTSRKELLSAFRKLLEDNGVRFLPSEVIGFDAERGKLVVHATSENMDKVEYEVQILSVPPPQVTITVKFVEIPKGDTENLLSVLKDTGIQNPGSGAVSRATSTTAEPDGSFAEVLTEQQFRDLLKAVEQRGGTDLMNESRVTTVSGRQAQIQSVDLKTVVEKINPQALAPPGVSGTNLFVTENLLLGPVLDVLPTVAEDGTTVSLDVTATVTAFVGYDEPAKGQEVQVYADGQVRSMKPPLPHLRVRQIQYKLASVTDGQTLMLGKPKDTMVVIDKDGKEIYEPGAEPKDLLVFLTTTLIDSIGNPIHSPAERGEK